MKTWGFKAKLITLCGFLCTISALIGLISFYGISKISTSYQRVSESALPNISSLGEMFASYRAIRINLRTLGLPDLDKETIEDAIKKATDQIGRYEQTNKLFANKEFLPKEKELYDELNKDWIVFRGVGERVLAFQKSGTLEGKVGMQQIFLKDCPEAAEEFTASMNKLMKFQKEFAQQSVTEATSAVSTTNFLNIAVILGGIISGIAVGLVFSNKITRSITEISTNLAESSEQVTSAAAQIAASSEQLSQATTEQAASLEETAASIEEMNSMVAKNSENANSAASSSKTSQTKALEGKSIVERMTRSMEAINQSNNAIMVQVNESNEAMAGIVKVIEQIEKKTKVINDIVNKTELLSFNASVEAARAGEHGRGFAVVAEEVGNLARMSGSAAEEIATLLEDSIGKVNKIVHDTKSNVERLIQEGRKTVEVGSQVARNCGEVFEEVVQNVIDISGMANEIASASQEQSQGCSEITKAMNQLDQMTQQNAATSEECASAAEELSSQAESLKGAVNQLVLTINGNNGTSYDSHHPKQPPVGLKSERKQIVKSIPLNILHLKKPLEKYPSQPKLKLKKVSGGAPSYDNGGFEED